MLILTVCVRLRGIAKTLVVPAQLVAQDGLGFDDDDRGGGGRSGGGGKHVMLIGTGARFAQRMYYSQWAAARQSAARQLFGNIRGFFSPMQSKLVPQQLLLNAPTHHHHHWSDHAEAATDEADQAGTAGETHSLLEVVVQDICINASVAELTALLTHRVTARAVASNDTVAAVTAATPGAVNVDEEEGSSAVAQTDVQPTIRRRRRRSSYGGGSGNNSGSGGAERCWVTLPPQYHHLLSMELWAGRACVGRFELNSLSGPAGRAKVGPGGSRSGGRDRHSVWRLPFPDARCIPADAVVVVKLLPHRTYANGCICCRCRRCRRFVVVVACASVRRARKHDNPSRRWRTRAGLWFLFVADLRYARWGCRTGRRGLAMNVPETLPCSTVSCQTTPDQQAVPPRTRSTIDTITFLAAVSPWGRSASPTTACTLPGCCRRVPCKWY